MTDAELNLVQLKELKLQLGEEERFIGERICQNAIDCISNLVEARVMPNGVIAGGRKRWKPKEKEIFYYVNFYTGVTEQIYTNSKIHTPRNLYKIGNCYKTKEEAQIKWNQIKKILLQR